MDDTEAVISSLSYRLGMAAQSQLTCTRLIPIVLCATLFLFLGCDGQETSDAPSALVEPESTDASAPQKPNIVIVLIDTVRADHTSLEAYDRDTTPGIRNFATGGQTFLQHFANAPWTRPSVASILTGLLPPSHGTQWGNMTDPEGEVDLLPEALDTIPELLQPHGYSTYAFSTNPVVSAHFGYGQGFDRFDQLPGTLEDDRRVVESAMRTLDSATGPVFIWGHFMAAHNYRVPVSSEIFPHTWLTPIKTENPSGEVLKSWYGMKSREQAMAVYDSAILHVDSVVTELLEHIRVNHPNTLVIITSDHGEEFAEHGGYLHGRTLYNELVRVPMILWGPGIPRGEIVERLTSSVDILPTILDYLDLPPTFTQGASMLGSSHDPNRVIYAEKRNLYRAMRSLTTRHGKFIESKPPGDPETKPLMEGEGSFEFFASPIGAEKNDSVEAMSKEDFESARDQLAKIWSTSRKIYVTRTGVDAVRGNMTNEDTENLRALGYIE